MQLLPLTGAGIWSGAAVDAGADKSEPVAASVDSSQASGASSWMNSSDVGKSAAQLGRLPAAAAAAELNDDMVSANGRAFTEYMSTVEELDVATGRNQAVFYSGPGNRALAEAFAKENGKLTLEMTPGGSWLDAQKLFGPKSPVTPEQARVIWSRLSERYSAQASGNVNAFVRGASPQGIFNTIEFPTLRYRNSNVLNVLTGGH